MRINCNDIGLLNSSHNFPNTWAHGNVALLVFLKNSWCYEEKSVMISDVFFSNKKIAKFSGLIFINLRGTFMFHHSNH